MHEFVKNNSRIYKGINVVVAFYAFLRAKITQQKRKNGCRYTSNKTL